MQEHKHAGKSATASHDHAHDHDHVPGPGKQSRVGHAGPIATAAGGNEGGFDTSASTSKSATFTEGKVHIETTVGVKLTKGHGKVSIDVSGGSVQVGNDKVAMDFKAKNAAQGKSLGVGGGGVTTQKLDTSQLAMTWRGPWFGTTWTTEWKVAHKDWTATFTVSSFAGVKPEPPKPKHQHGHSIIHKIGHGIVAAAQAVHDAEKAILESADEWGPVVIGAAAVLAGGATSVASG